MLRCKPLLVELLDYIELFGEVVPEAEQMGLDAFLGFVQSLRGSEGEGAGHGSALIARHLSLMHRYSRALIKQALAESEYLQSEEEYTYLVCLLGGAELNKAELHRLNALEKTTGAEVLRRLKAHELISEAEDPSDKRSVLVRITPKGRSELMRVLPALQKAADSLVAPLEPAQQTTLGVLLELLVGAHQPRR